MYDINKIASIAHSQNKFSKKDTWRAVQYLIDNCERCDGSDPNEFESNLAGLYSYFKPAPSKKPKNKFEWVTLAMGKNDVRYYLNFIYSDGKRTMATDGHRLHIWNETREAGYYNNFGSKIEETAKYPDVDRVIPQATGREIDLQKLIKTANNNVKQIEKQGIKPIEAALCGKGYVQHPYFDDAIAMFDPDEKIRFYQSADNKPVLMRQGDITAVVMPQSQLA